MEGGPVGLIVVGLGGVGSSLLSGLLAARAHLVHPFGIEVIVNLPAVLLGFKQCTLGEYLQML